jgi:hypothetical protein
MLRAPVVDAPRTSTRHRRVPPIADSAVKRGADLLREFADLISLVAECASLGHASQSELEPAFAKIGSAIADLRSVLQSEMQRVATPRSFHDATNRFQAQLVRATIEREGWNIAETARALRLNRGHVYSLLREFDIRRPPGEPRGSASELELRNEVAPAALARPEAVAKPQHA